MVIKTQTEFDLELVNLEDAFARGGRPNETNKQIAKAIVTFILKRERRRRGVPDRGRRAQTVDSETIAKMQSWDSEDPRMSTLEKVFHRLTSGREGDAISLLKASITAKADAISKEQTRKARLPRGGHPITVLIETLVRARPGISVAELEQALLRESGPGRRVICDMDEEVICPSDQKFRTLAVSGLKDQLMRAKRKIAKAG